MSKYLNTFLKFTGVSKAGGGAGSASESSASNQREEVLPGISADALFSIEHKFRFVVAF